MKIEVGNIAEIEVGTGNYFMVQMTKEYKGGASFYADVVEGGSGNHLFDFIQVRKVFTREKNPEYYL